MAQGMPPLAVPGKEPGEILIPMLGRSFKQIELREDDIFDTVQIASGSVASTKLELFDVVADKNLQHKSFSQAHKLPAGDEAAVFRVGIHVRATNGNVVQSAADFKKIYESGALTLLFNRRLITEGPLLKYQSGYGVYGSSMETGVNSNVMSNGVPSAAAAPTLFVPQQLTDKDDVKGNIEFPTAAWVTSYTAASLDARNLISIFLRSVIKSPLGK